MHERARHEVSITEQKHVELGGTPSTRRLLATYCLLLAGILGLVMAQTPIQAEPLSFGVIADVQYADQEDLGSRHYRQSLGLLEAAVAGLNSRELEFVVQLGDLVDGGTDSINRVLLVFNQLKARKYHVLGNHDFPSDREIMMRKLGLAEAYYSFAGDGWRFVVLDTQDISLDGGWPAESEHYKKAQSWWEQLKLEGKPNAEPWNGGIGEGQKEWLRQQLAEASAKGERVIVFGHIPLLEAASADWCLLYNHEEIVAILEQYSCVAAYFAGHDHGGGYAERNGIYHVTLYGMVEAGPQNAYAMLTLRPDAIVIEGIGTVPSRMLKLAQCATAPTTPPSQPAEN